jgi:hypothetical protein
MRQEILSKNFKLILPSSETDLAQTRLKSDRACCQISTIDIMTHEINNRWSEYAFPSSPEIMTQLFRIMFIWVYMSGSQHFWHDAPLWFLTNPNPLPQILFWNKSNSLNSYLYYYLLSTNSNYYHIKIVRKIQNMKIEILHRGLYFAMNDADKYWNVIAHVSF